MDLLCYSWQVPPPRQLHLLPSSASSRPVIAAAVATTFRCSSKNNTDTEIESETSSTTTTPLVLRFAVSAATEILSLLTPSNRSTDSRTDFSGGGTDGVGGLGLGLGLDGVVELLQADYANAYFLTGNFTPEIYAEDCLFEDPTIKFRGKKQYARNLGLLVPFFDSPSLELKSIKKGVPVSNKPNFILATWRLRTYLNLPWKPLISVEGSTEYYLNDNYQIIRHAERWNVSAIEAVGQIFKPS